MCVCHGNCCENSITCFHKFSKNAIILHCVKVQQTLLYFHSFFFFNHNSCKEVKIVWPFSRNAKGCQDSTYFFQKMILSLLWL